MAKPNDTIGPKESAPFERVRAPLVAYNKAKHDNEWLAKHPSLTVRANAEELRRRLGEFRTYMNPPHSEMLQFNEIEPQSGHSSAFIDDTFSLVVLYTGLFLYGQQPSIVEIMGVRQQMRTLRVEFEIGAGKIGTDGDRGVFRLMCKDPRLADKKKLLDSRMVVSGADASEFYAAVATQMREDIRRQIKEFSTRSP